VEETLLQDSRWDGRAPRAPARVGTAALDRTGESTQGSPMGQWRSRLLALGLAAAWAGPAAGEQGQPLTGAEITATISGNTVKGNKFAEYYDPNGTIRGREGDDSDDSYQGSWHVEGDKLCVAFPSHDFTSCVWIAPLEGGIYSFMDGQRTDLRTIVGGNPGGF
jgi:hypothetical protein